MPSLKFFLLNLLWPALALAHVEENSRSRIVVHPEDEYFDSHRHDTTEKIEVLTKERIEKSNSTSLNEAIDRMPGVDSQDYCVNCGAKRISINGLRGDHTSVLIDGIPLYSAVTSVYGFDAIAMQSVEELEVKRGTGSALLNPEAIGGTINIITLMPKESGTRSSFTYGTYRTQNAELLHNYVSPQYKLSVGGEFNRQQPWDEDNNDFAESPWKSRYSIFAKQTVNLSSRTQWALRGSWSDLEIIGGGMGHSRLTGSTTVLASESDFVDGDVRKNYIGDTNAITENVLVKRSEITSKMIHIINSKNTIEWNMAGAVYDQTSYYMHGFDYKTKDTTAYTDIRWKQQLTDDQALTLGSSLRYETLRSESQVMYDTHPIPKDNFDYHTLSLFAQHEWLWNEDWELSTALRAERLQSDWNYLGEIKKNVISPRLLLKWEMNEHFSQQWAYGYGYRMPLTSIESAHGAYDGFVIDIDKMETAHSLLYSVSYNTPEFYITPSLHYTRLQNMAYAKDPLVPHSGPLKFVSAEEDYNIVVYDILTGFKPLPDWLIEVGYEYYSYPDGYKAKLPTAAIEKRINLRSEIDWKKFSFVMNAQWVGARDLASYYQYPDHYNIDDGLLGVSDPKRMKSPPYWQVDASITRKIQSWEWMIGVQNLFNYTQSRAGDSPAMWHLHGDHAHLDNRHVWGPNKGREVFAKLTFNF